MLHLIDNRNVNISKITNNEISCIESLEKLCFNKLRFKPKKYYFEGGIEFDLKNLKLNKVVYCCRDISEIYSGPQIKEIKKINVSEDVEKVICKHVWISTRNGNKDRVHNFGRGKQYLYYCRNCGARQKRDYNKK